MNNVTQGIIMNQNECFHLHQSRLVGVFCLSTEPALLTMLTLAFCCLLLGVLYCTSGSFNCLRLMNSFSLAISCHTGGVYSWSLAEFYSQAEWSLFFTATLIAWHVGMKHNCTDNDSFVSDSPSQSNAGPRGNATPKTIFSTNYSAVGTYVAFCVLSPRANPDTDKWCGGELMFSNQGSKNAREL